MLQLPTSRLVLLHKSQAPFLSEAPSKLQQPSPRGIKILFSKVCGVPLGGFIALKHHALDHLLGWGYYHKTAREEFAKPMITSSLHLTGCPPGRAPGGLNLVNLQNGRQCLELLSQAQDVEGDRKQTISSIPVVPWLMKFKHNCLQFATHSKPWLNQTQPDVADSIQTDTIEASKNMLPPSTPMILFILVVAIYCFYPLNMHFFSCAIGTLVSPGES